MAESQIKNMKTSASGVRYRVPVTSPGQASQHPVRDNDKNTLKLPPLPAARVVKKGHPCTLCEKEFATKRDLRLHLYIHKEKPNLACLTCNKNFTTQSQLKKHERSHNTKRRMCECTICKQLFPTVKELEAHHREEHIEHKPFRCNICGIVFSWEKNLEKHLRSHQEQNHHCTLCGRGFWDMTSMRVHMRNFHSNPSVKDEPYRCSVCGKTFKFDFSYEAHLNAHEIYGQSVQTVTKIAAPRAPESAMLQSRVDAATEAPSAETMATTTAELLTPDGESREIVVEIVNVPTLDGEESEGVGIPDLQLEGIQGSDVKLEGIKGSSMKLEETSNTQQKGFSDTEKDEDEEEKEEMPPPPLVVLNGNSGGDTRQLGDHYSSPSPGAESPLIEHSPESSPLLETSNTSLLEPLIMSKENSTVSRLPPVIHKSEYDLSDDDEDDDIAPTLPVINEQALNGNPNRMNQDAPPKLDPIIIRPRTGPGKITTHTPHYVQASNRPKKPKPERKTHPQPLMYNFVMSEEKPFQCQLCMEKFRWEISLQIHTRDAHIIGPRPKEKRASASRPRKPKAKAKKAKGEPVAMSQILRSRASSDEEEDYDAMAMISPDSTPSPEKKKGRQLRKRKGVPENTEDVSEGIISVKRRRGKKGNLATSDNGDLKIKIKLETDSVQKKGQKGRKTEEHVEGSTSKGSRKKSKKTNLATEADLEDSLVEPNVQSDNNEIDVYMKEFEAIAQKQVEEECEGQDEPVKEEEEDSEHDAANQEEEEEEEEEEEIAEEIQQSLPRSFTAHIRWTQKLHFRKAVYVCRFCTKLFTNKQSCRMHQVRHSGKRCLACSDCDNKFPDRSALVIHRVQHTWSDPLACGLCAKMCSSTRSLAKHIFTHRSLKSTPCPRCRKLFVSTSSLERHLPTHGVASPCHSEVDLGLETINFAPGMYDIDPHQGAGAVGYTCDICHKLFDQQDKFELHQKTGCIFSAFLP